MTAAAPFFSPVTSTLSGVPAAPASSEQALPYTAFLGLGSNLGDPIHILQVAWYLLSNETFIQTIRLSDPYHSDPLSMHSEHRFVNAVALVRTGLTPLALLERLSQIEMRCGRTRSATEAAGYQDRTLDLDLLFFDDQVIKTRELILPHPRMHERLFVLAPLAQIAPTMVHPLFSQPVSALLQDLRQTNLEQRVERGLWPVRR